MSGNYKGFYEFGPFRIDSVGHQLWRDGEEISLTPKAFKILVLLLEHPGETLLKDELMKAVWPDAFVEENNLADNISILRHALGDDPKSPQYIKTIQRRGYRFVASVNQWRKEEVGLVRPEHPVVGPIGEEEMGASQASAITNVGPLQASSSAPASAVTQPAPLPRPGRNRVVALVVIGLIVGGSAGFIALSRYLRKGSPAKAEREMTITRATNSGKSGAGAISPDGKLIAYVQNYTPGNPSAGSGSLYVRQVGANHEVQLLEPGERVFGGTAFSPDSTLIYYVVFDKRDPKGALYRIPALGGPPTRLLGDIISMFSLSPDGNRVAFYRFDPALKQLNLMIAPVDGGGSQILLTRPYNDAAYTGIPAWSPDGRMIAFVPDPAVTKHGDNGESETIYAIDIASGAIKSLTDERWAGVRNMVWMSDGRGLILIGFRLRTGNQLYHLSYPEGTVRRLTSGVQGLGSYGLGITSDSRLLVADSYESSAQLWLVGSNGDTTRAIRLTTGDYDGRRGLAGLPDGRIVYVAREGGEYDFWTIKEDGTEAKPLTADSFFDREVATTPDGRYLVFTSDRDGSTHIFRADRDGSRPQQLTFGQAQTNMPDSSPDGRWVVYASTQNEKTTIWKVSIEGGTPVQLTDYECVAPNYSPDGKFISCIVPAESVAQKGSIAVVSAGGGPPIKSFKVVPFSWSYLSVRWTPDGQALIFRDSESLVTNLWKQPLAGGPPSQLTDFKTEIIFNYAFSRATQRLILSRGQTLSNVVLIRDFK
jgi:Tol biopolymer transport system component/DNA-binding winged helix-turn-helix (wHTH) protein